jgi:hypothetical protein
VYELPGKGRSSSSGVNPTGRTEAFASGTGFPPGVATETRVRYRRRHRYSARLAEASPEKWSRIEEGAIFGSCTPSASLNLMCRLGGVSVRRLTVSIDIGSSVTS